MAMGDMSGITLKDVDCDLYRNIITVRGDQNLFDDLSDSDADWGIAQAIELEFKPAQYDSRQPIIDRPFEDAALLEAINFPFKNWAESRFSRGEYGVWYGSEELNTTIYETAYHWRRGLLADSGFDNVEGAVSERRIHLVRCTGALIDLEPKRNDWSQLRSDDYSQCQTLGQRLQREGHPGLWTPSARCEGTNAAIFTPRILSNSRIHCYLTYTLINNRVEVQREIGKTLLTI
jgi:hypothetical protein